MFSLFIFLNQPADKQLAHHTVDYSSTCCHDNHLKPSTCASARRTVLLKYVWERFRREQGNPTNQSPGWTSAASISCNFHAIGSFPLRFDGKLM